MTKGFVTAVLAIEPNATGEAVALYESGNTVVRAFVEAGLFSLSAIAVLLSIALRRIGDVLLTLVPLLVAGVVTLELCVVLGLPLNFANIIALLCHCYWASVSHLRSTTSWRGGPERPPFCNRSSLAL